MKKSLIAVAVALSIGIPAVPVHAGLFDGFFNWLSDAFSSKLKQRKKDQALETKGTAVNQSERSAIANQIMPDQYGAYRKGKQCWGKSCMTADIMNKVSSRHGTLYYVLASDENAQAYDLYALKQVNGRYKVLSKMHHQGMGISGDGMFIRLGNDLFGWNIMSGDKGQSTLMEDYFVVQDEQIRHVASIQEFGRSKPSGTANIYSGDLKMGRSSGSAFYPINVTVKGVENAKVSCATCEPRGGKKIPTKTYVFEYDQQTGRYQMPAGYPMTKTRF